MDRLPASLALRTKRTARCAKTTFGLLLVVVLGAMAGCGQKGPLTLPSASSAASAPAAR